MAEEARPDQPSNDWAFALVHGIGTAQPLDMIQEVTDALRVARPSLVLENGAEVHEVHEPDPENPLRSKARHHVIRHGHIPGGKVRFGTAHWADITYYRQGFLALIGSLLLTAFGVRFFAEVAARDASDSGPVERVLSFLLRNVLNVMVVFLAVVVFPITFVSLVYSIAALVAEYAIRDKVGFPGVQFIDLQRWFIVIVSVGGCGLCAWIGLSRVRPMRKERTLGVWIFSSIALFATAVGALMPFHNTQVGWPVFFGQPGQTCGLLRDCFREYLMLAAQWNPYHAARIDQADGIGIFLALLNFLQIMAGIVMLVLTVAVLLCLLAYCVAAIVGGRPFLSMVFATVCTITIWIVLLIVMWPENLANYSASLRFTRTEAPQYISAMFFQWEALPWHFYAEKIPVKGKDSLESYYPIQWFEGTYFLFLCSTLIMIGMVIVARKVICWARQDASLSGFRVDEGSCAPRYCNWPRLIVANLYVSLVLIFLAFASIVFTTHVFDFEPLLLQWLKIGTPENKAPHEVFFRSEWVRLAVIVFVTFFIFFSHYILDGIRLVLDVVNHFTQPNYPSGPFPVRRRIEDRFDEIVERLLAPGDKPNLVIIAHSQGTVITLDALLRQGWIDRVMERASTLTVITFGSPITHVYQRYFPHVYTRLAETNLGIIAGDPRVRWVNGYRIDDYVGTYIENSIPNFPVNVPLPVGGHTAYWQGDVMRRILSEPVLHDFILTALRQDTAERELMATHPDYLR